MATKNRSDLKSYFVKNAIPTEGNFADLIDSQLNQTQDGVFKPDGDAFSVVAASGDQKRVLRLFANYPAANPDWMISLNPAQDPANAATTSRAGLGITDGTGKTRLFIDATTGQIGVGTNTPQVTLDVAGGVRIQGAVGGVRMADRAATSDSNKEWTVYANQDYLRFSSGAQSDRLWIKYDTGDWHFAGTYQGALSVTGPDICLDNPDRRAGHTGGVRRALVHGGNDQLVLNYGNDYTGGVLVAGSFNVSGTKNFYINHPLDPEHRLLQHACIEGPEAAVYYRGEGQLCDGVASIELPRYFEALVHKEGRTVQLTPLWEPGVPCSPLAGSEVKDGRFVVRTVDQKSPDQRFYWEVKAIRSDVPALEIEPLKPQ